MIPGRPQPERPAVLDTRPNGLEVTSLMYSINDKALGAGEPIRVKAGDRVLMHLLNASGIENRLIALPGHQFHVIALDGNPVPGIEAVEVLAAGAGRADRRNRRDESARRMDSGRARGRHPQRGLGIVVEYAGQSGTPQWMAPKSLLWDYTVFGRRGFAAAAGPDHRDGL